MKEETNSNQHQQNCWFYDHKVSLGFCTYYGACRVGQQDFMYQGGCGEMTDWGRQVRSTESKVFNIFYKKQCR